MASVTRNQAALCDRNCHKSIEHAITMSGAIPTYLLPSRNHYGLIGPIPPHRLTPEAVQRAMRDNPLNSSSGDAHPIHAIVTNSTYDGLCYNVKRVENSSVKVWIGSISTKRGTATPASTPCITIASPCMTYRTARSLRVLRSSRPSPPTNCWRRSLRLP